MQQYCFHTTWKYQARISDIWPVIKDIENWPHWWKGVECVKILHPGELNGMSKKAAMTWKSLLPYRLTFVMEVTGIVENEKITGHTTGELQGTGTWYFSQEGAFSVLQFHWDVMTTPAWMNVFAPLLKPVFKWNHDIIMLWGREGLGAKLNR
jgi:hypothetical protein